MPRLIPLKSTFIVVTLALSSGSIHAQQSADEANAAHLAHLVAQAQRLRDAHRYAMADRIETEIKRLEFELHGRGEDPAPRPPPRQYRVYQFVYEFATAAAEAHGLFYAHDQALEWGEAKSKRAPGRIRRWIDLYKIAFGFAREGAERNGLMLNDVDARAWAVRRADADHYGNLGDWMHVYGLAFGLARAPAAEHGMALPLDEAKIWAVAQADGGVWHPNLREFIERYKYAMGFAIADAAHGGLMLDVPAARAWAKRKADRSTLYAITLWIEGYGVGFRHAILPVDQGGLGFTPERAKAWAELHTAGVDERYLRIWMPRYTFVRPLAHGLMHEGIFGDEARADAWASAVSRRYDGVTIEALIEEYRARTRAASPAHGEPLEIRLWAFQQATGATIISSDIWIKSHRYVLAYARALAAKNAWTLDEGQLADAAPAQASRFAPFGQLVWTMIGGKAWVKALATCEAQLR